MGRFINRKLIIYVQITMMLSFNYSCKYSMKEGNHTIPDTTPEVVIKKRDDGTLSSVNQVDEMGYVNGTRISYYADGKTIYSRLTFKHGIKQGPSIWYYNNGQTFKHVNFDQGKMQGLARKYHRNGKLLAEFECEKGNVLPGLKEYSEDGTLLTSYPEVAFRELNYLETKNRIDLEIYCSEKLRGIKYFLLEKDNDNTSRVYLITENGKASMQYYVKPGDMLNKKLEIIAEIPTNFGNIMAKRLTYHLTATNMKSR